MIDVSFSAELVPEAAPRPRAVRMGAHARVYTPKKALEWQSRLASKAALVMPPGQIDEPLRLDFIAVFPRPKSLSGKKHAAGLLMHDRRPDLDNIAKNILDALRPFWRDDAIVVGGHWVKAYAERDGRARVMVRVRSAEDFGATFPVLSMAVEEK
jgi:Holliday junction resolvase RusA-like endonuclease